jgi:hypothetical protein
LRGLAQECRLGGNAVEQIVEPYEAWIAAADPREAAEHPTDRDRLAIALVALANQERVLILETRTDRIASSATVRILLRNAGARADGRLGYCRAADEALLFPLGFRAAYFVTDISAFSVF